MENWSAADIAGIIALAGTTLAAIGGGVWKVLSWLGENVIKPVVKAHVDTLESLRKTALDQKDAISRLAEVMEQQTAILSDLGERVERIEQRANICESRRRATKTQIRKEEDGA